MRPRRDGRLPRDFVARAAGAAGVIVYLVALLLPGHAAAQAGGVEALPLGKKAVRVGFDTYADTEAINVVAKVMLERLGYTVDVQTFDVGVLFAAVADGKVDVYSGAALPDHHKDYWDKFGDRSEKVGPFHKEFQAGLAVPTYVTDVNSISDLVGKEARFGNKIVGHGAGAGTMRKAAEAVKVYGLKMPLVESSEAAESAALQKAIGANEPIVAAVWKPMWWWGKWSLKYLADPREAFGRVNWVWHDVRKGLKQDSPRAYAFYERYHMTADQQGYLMLQIVEGKKGEDAAKAFIAENPGLVKEWLGQ